MPLPNACACIRACYKWPRLTSHCQMALENIHKKKIKKNKKSNRSQHSENSILTKRNTGRKTSLKRAFYIQ